MRTSGDDVGDLPAITPVASDEQTKIGFGSISLADGVSGPDHGTHRSGLEVDVRAIRKDGWQLPVTCYQSQYDHAATAALVGLFFSYPGTRSMLFNRPPTSPTSKCLVHLSAA